MQGQLMSDVYTIINKYEEKLSLKGVKCSVQKRYFEFKVSGTSGSRSNIFAEIHRNIVKRREEKYFKYQNNRYHCIVLCFSPIDENILKQTECREYSFCINKIEREEIGYSPKSKAVDEGKMLKQTERIIVKFLDKAERRSIVSLCRENWCDAFRYISHREYGYKKRILGKDRVFWEILFAGIFLSVITLFCLGFFIIKHFL